MSIFDQRLDLEDSNTIKGSKKEMLHGNEKVLNQKFNEFHKIGLETQIESNDYFWNYYIFAH